MPSILQITAPTTLVNAYLNPANGFAWPLYDEDPAPDTLSGVDLTAPALLSYPIRGEYLDEMGRTGTDYEKLVCRMREFLKFPDGNYRFVDLKRNVVRSLKGPRATRIKGPAPWEALVACLDAVQKCEGLTSVAVTKILHRKRPNLVPINDSYVREFYGKRRGYGPLFEAIWDDLHEPGVRPLLHGLVTGRNTPWGRPLTELRALDIVVWMHQRQLVPQRSRRQRVSKRR